uniref:CSON003452 protein n=1 Tax=Culicoides sonorensis TaxID=179676 RepID=A0A336MR31_CULSO
MFNPENHGLEADFRCKVPQNVLDKYLELLGKDDVSKSSDSKHIGIGMDSAVIPLPNHQNLFLVQTVDFFYPLIDDPYLMGKIAFANVVSDIFATGVTMIDKIKMIISAPTEFTEKQRDVVLPLMIKAFKDCADEIKTTLDIDWMAVNPWCMLGGIATSVCHESEIIFPTDAQIDDVLVLTKPLGTQLATNSYIWMKENSDEWKKLKSSEKITEQQVLEMYDSAVKSMSFLNKTAAELMHKYKAHAATDVTGFGLLGHAHNLAEFQKENVSFVIDTLPVIKDVPKVAEILGRDVKLRAGKAVETSGGLLISISKTSVQDFIQEFECLTEFRAIIVGKVISGEKKAKMSETVTIIEV